MWCKDVGLGLVAAWFALVVGACGTNQGADSSATNADETVAEQRQALFGGIDVPEAGEIATFAGKGPPNLPGAVDNADARLGTFNDPAGIAVGRTNPTNIVYVADAGNSSIRAINPNGSLTTVITGRPNLLVNPRAEDASAPTGINGWTISTGQWQPLSRGAQCNNSVCGYPYDGTYWFWGGSVADALAYQDVNVSTNANIAAGTQKYHFSALIRGNTSDQARVQVQYLKSDKSLISTGYDSGFIRPSIWTPVTDERVPPTTTKFIRVTLQTHATSGTSADSYFDAIELRAMRPSNAPASDTDKDLFSPTALGVLSNGNLVVGGSGVWIINPTTKAVVIPTATNGYVPPRRVSGVSVVEGADYVYLADPTDVYMHVRTPNGFGYRATVDAGANAEPLAVAAKQLDSSNDLLWITYRRFPVVYQYKCPRLSLSANSATIVTCTPERQYGTTTADFRDDVDGEIGDERFSPALYGLATGLFDDVLVADEYNRAVRRSGGDYTRTLGGGGTSGYVDGPLVSSRFASPAGIAVAPNGRDVLVADRGNNTIRKISCAASDACAEQDFCPWIWPNDGDECTNDSCEVLAVRHQVKAHGASCSDGDVCNGDEWCNEGICTSREPLVVNDNEPCTEDLCDPVAGVSHPAKCAAPFICSVGICKWPCTTEAECDPGHYCSQGGFCQRPRDRCLADADCRTGLVCALGMGPGMGDTRLSNVCLDPICLTPAAASLCGYEGAPCPCGNGKECSDNSDCLRVDLDYGMEECVAGAGDRVGMPGASVCMHKNCRPGSQFATCGSVTSLCGECPTTTTCAGKTCGDDPSDGLGGICPNLCSNGQCGCTTDQECAVGSYCAKDKGTALGCAAGKNVCLPRVCLDMDPMAPKCGVGDANCGPCPTCTATCSGKQCGKDACGRACPVTAAGACNSDGRAVSYRESSDFHTPDFPDSLPTSLADEVGALAGSFSVNDRGLGSYTIPIAVPPGRAGLTPSLALRYTGTKTEGLMGPGWRVDGFSAIARCADTFATGGSARPVRLDANDVFCLDGQPLILVTANVAYGAQNSEYRTEIDTFQRVILRGNVGTAAAYKGPQYFDVYTKDGRILTYGSTLANDTTSLESHGVKRVWAISRIKDQAANTIDFKYLEQVVAPGDAGESGSTALDSGELRPDAIVYGSESDGDRSRWIKFEYEPRPDPQYHFVNGARGFSVNRLTYITTTAFGEGVRRYQVKYAETGITKVREIVEWDGDGVRHKAGTTFDYVPFESYVESSDVSLDLDTGDSITGTGDLDGDGLTDVVVRHSDGKYQALLAGKSFQNPINLAWTNGSYLASLVTQLDGNGRSGIVDPTGKIFELDDGEFSVSTFTGAAGGVAQAIFWDHDGDGQQDLITCSDNPQQFSIWRNNRGILNGPSVIGSSKKCGTLTPIDVDGDGTEELLQTGYDGKASRFLKFSGSIEGPTLTPLSVDYSLNLDADQKVIAMDFNGDGLKDLLAVKVVSSTKLTLWESTGRKFVARTVEIPEAQMAKLSSYELQHSAVFDYNGDGRDDLVLGGGSGVRALTPYNRYELWQLAPELGINKPFFGDVDGNGSPDLIGVDSDGGHVAFGNAGAANLLQTVTDGLNKHIDVQYEASTEDLAVAQRTLDSAGMGCFIGTSFDSFDAISQLGPLVSEFSEKIVVDTDERPGTRQVFQYRCPLKDAKGRGFRSFRGRTILTLDDDGDEKLNTEIAYWYDEYVYAGMPARISRRTPLLPANDISDAQQRGTQDNYWFEIGTSRSGARPFPKLAHRKHHEYDFSGDSPREISVNESYYVTDSDGNVTEVRSTGGGLPSKVNFVYYPPATPWKIGLLKDLTLTDTVDNVSVKRSTHYTYLTSGLLDTVEREVGDSYYYLKTAYGRDSYGNVTSVTTTDGAGSTRTSAIAFDATGDFPISYTNEEQQVSEIFFDARTGLPSVVTDPNFVTRRWGYDGFGRLVRTEGPDDGTSVSFASATPGTSPISSASDFGVVSVTATDDSGPKSVTVLDAFGRAVRGSSTGYGGTNVLQEMDYDWAGRLVGITLPHVSGDTSQGYTSYDFDRAGKLYRTRLPDGDSIGYQYASKITLKPELAAVLPSAVDYAVTINPRKNVDWTTYGASGLVTSSIEASSLAAGATLHTVKYSYGHFDELATVTDQLSNVTKIESDRLGRSERITDPDTGVETRVFSAWGEIIKATDAANAVQEMVYDRLGRRKQINRPSEPPFVEWRYDEGGAAANAIGKLTSTSRIAQPGSTAKVTLTATYESPLDDALLNRGLISRIDRTLPDETGALRTLTTSMTYGSFGRLDTLSYPSAPPTVAGGTPTAFRVKHEYDSASGALKKVSDPDANKTYWSVVSVDQGFRLGKVELGNGLFSEYRYYSLNDTSASCTGGAGLSCTPGRIKDVLVGTAANNRSVLGLNYTFDENGNTKTRSVIGGTDLDTYAYDDFDQLKTATRKVGSATKTLSYTFDALGNMLTKTDVGTYTYAGSGRPHAPNNIGSTTFHYDARGNQDLREGSLIAGGRQAIDYNDFDMPWRVTSGPAATPTQVTTYDYDAFQNRVAKRTAAEQTLYAGRLYRRVAKTGSVEHRYTVYAGDSAVAEVTRVETAGLSGAAEVLYEHGDQLGSISVVTDASKVVRVKRTFDPFGLEESTVAQRKVRDGFTGHEGQDDLGLINMRGRIYDPKLGQFLQADPFVSGIGPRAFNRYAYVSNNPLTMTDPSGFFSLKTFLQGIPGWNGSSNGGGAGTLGDKDNEGGDGGGTAPGGDNPIATIGIELAKPGDGAGTSGVMGGPGPDAGALGGAEATSGSVGNGGLADTPELPGNYSGGVSGTYPGAGSPPPGGGGGAPPPPGGGGGGGGGGGPGNQVRLAPNPGGGASLGGAWGQNGGGALPGQPRPGAGQGRGNSLGMAPAVAACSLAPEACAAAALAPYLLPAAGVVAIVGGGYLIWTEVFSKAQHEREGDGTRGKTYEEIKEAFKDKLTKGELKKLIDKVQKIRGERNAQKRGK